MTQKKVILFTFHIVQIKLISSHTREIGNCLFTFHIVQIKLGSQKEYSCAKNAIYIPHSSDKTVSSNDKPADAATFTFHIVQIKLFDKYLSNSAV